MFFSLKKKNEFLELHCCFLATFKELFFFKSYLSGNILEYPKLNGRSKSFPTRTMVVPTFTSANPYEPPSSAGFEPGQEFDG